MPIARFFRFHLLTLVFASVLAGGVLYLNLQSEIGTIRDPFFNFNSSIPGSPKDFLTRNYGWPETAVKLVANDERPSVYALELIVLDAAVFLLIVVGASFVFERIVFRRGA